MVARQRLRDCSVGADSPVDWFRGSECSDAIIVEWSAQLAQALRMCKLYVSFTGRRVPRLETGGGWRRTRVRRERRWPSFTLWRWAGPALDGWIRCRWRARPLLPPHRRPHPMAPLRSQRRAAGQAQPGRAGNQPRSRARKAPRRQQGRREDRRSVRLVRAPERVARLLVRRVGQPSVRLARAPGRVARLLVRPVGQPSVRPARAPGRAASRAANIRFTEPLRLSREPPVAPGPRHS
jgi:hypothetical protein